MPQKDDNQEITLNSYELAFYKYLADNPSTTSGYFKDFIDKVLIVVSKDAKILEIGSGIGRDANYIESLGYQVLRTDLVDNFIDYQKTQGKNILKFDIINDRLETKFDLILAFAVLLHLNKAQLDRAITNILEHLDNDGYFAFTLKKGEGEEFSSHKLDQPRYFHYWQENEIGEIFEKAGFSIIHLDTRPDGKWISCLIKKE